MWLVTLSKSFFRQQEIVTQERDELEKARKNLARRKPTPESAAKRPKKEADGFLRPAEKQ